MSKLVLSVDKMGHPVSWIKPQDAVAHYVKGDVIWELGPSVATFRSGKSRDTGEITIIEPSAIIGLNGQAIGKMPERAPNVGGKNRHMLFARDRWTCAYCGGHFEVDDLSKDHIHPLSKGGRDHWMNLVTACKPCNSRKADKHPHEANMELLFLPYIPSRYEGLILRNRRILADQMEFLMARVPKNSRLWGVEDELLRQQEEVPRIIVPRKKNKKH